jgi:tripartite-type tricarboxylate transporter receptor subunit TctC
LGDHRALQLPEVPAARETGGKLSGFHASSWNGLAVPAKTPKDVIARLNKELTSILAMPDIKKRLLELNLSAKAARQSSCRICLQPNIKRWGDVIAQAKIAKH